MELRSTIPLARRFGPMEVVDSAIWFARDNAVAFVTTAGAGGLAFALALATCFNRLGALPPGAKVEDHLVEVAIWGVLLAALFLGRGLGHWAVVERLSASLRGETRTPEACWAAALKNPGAALFLAGVPGMAQWAGFLAIWPGLAFMNRWSGALPAAVFEKLEPARALRRSRDLMAGSNNAMAVWGFLFVAWVILFVNVLFAGAMLPDFLRGFFGINLPRFEQAVSPGNGLFIAVAIVFTWAACDALRAVAFAILYLNARIEREGGDLQSRLEAFRSGRRAGVASYKAPAAEPQEATHA
ncbi:MAG: hypothetical protein AAB074_07165 [Planctomycetota bacterium]